MPCQDCDGMIICGPNEDPCEQQMEHDAKPPEDPCGGAPWFHVGQWPETNPEYFIYVKNAGANSKVALIPPDQNCT